MQVPDTFDPVQHPEICGKHIRMGGFRHQADGGFQLGNTFRHRGRGRSVGLGYAFFDNSVVGTEHCNRAFIDRNLLRSRETRDFYYDIFQFPKPVQGLRNAVPVRPGAVHGFSIGRQDFRIPARKKCAAGFSFRFGHFGEHTSFEPCSLRDFRKTSSDIGSCVCPVRNRTERAVFDAFFGIPEVSAAALAEHVQRAVTEQTVEGIRVLYRMAGEIRTGAVLEK